MLWIIWPWFIRPSITRFRRPLAYLGVYIKTVDRSLYYRIYFLSLGKYLSPVPNKDLTILWIVYYDLTLAFSRFDSVSTLGIGVIPTASNSSIYSISSGFIVLNTELIKKNYISIYYRYILFPDVDKIRYRYTPCYYRFWYCLLGGRRR